MQYAIIRSGNKQYQVKVGSTIMVERLEDSAGSVVFDQVLLNVDGDKVELGNPTVSGLKVYGTAQGLVKAAKIQVFKYKSKSRYRKLRGHRQGYTSVKIDSIGAAPKEPAPKETPAKKPVAKKTVAKKPVTKKPAAKKSQA